MFKDRAFLVRVVKTSNPNASDEKEKSPNLIAPQVEQIAVLAVAVYTYVVALHTARDLILIVAKAKIR